MMLMIMMMMMMMMMKAKPDQIGFLHLINFEATLLQFLRHILLTELFLTFQSIISFYVERK